MNCNSTLTKAALLLLLSVLAASRASAQDEPVRYRIPVTAHEPTRGPADALVTIVVFNDFECPFCSRVQETIERVIAAHPRDVRIVFRNMPLPFHEHASLAAQAAMEAFAQGGNAAFWRMHDRLFANQRALERADLERYATELHLDLRRFRRALDNGSHAGEIDSDVAIAELFRVSGTPNFMINGRQLTGAQPYDAFDVLVSDELRRANLLVNRGTPRTRVYAELTRDALTRGTEAPSAAPTPRQVPDPTAIYAVPIGASPVHGQPNALVTIVEFTDLQCPFCARVQPTLAELGRLYGRDVRFVLKHNPLPFHNRAQSIARLLVWATARGKVWPLHDRIFANQTALADDDLVGYAVAAGLDARGARAALSDRSLDAAIRADQDLASALGATGTPAFFINGRRLSGAQPIQAFRDLVDAELTAARARVSAGIRPTALYDSIVQNGLQQARMIDAPGARAAAPDPDDDRVYALTVPTDAPRRGAARGRVVVQQFSDFQCPFCSRVEPTVSALIARYGDRVTFVWRDYPLPFHDNAMPAAEAAREVRTQLGVAAFWRYHATLFANQQALTRSDLEGFATALGGIDMRRFRAALDAHTHEAAVRADMSAVTAAGAQIGTPAFLIDGRLLQGAQPMSAFVTAIDRALAESTGVRGGTLTAPPPPAPAPPAPSTALLAPTDVAAAPASATRTPSGLASRVITAGRGTRHPGPASRVEVHYTGWTTDGRMFDSSVQRGSPAQFPLSGVIRGWTEGVQLMVEGETRRIWIPGALAYGDDATGGRPAGTLVFDITLLRIVD